MSTNTIFTQCDVCGRDICYGNAVLEIERNVEQHDYEEETGLQSVTVVDSDPLVTICAHCGNSMADRKEIWKYLIKTLALPAPATSFDAAQQNEEGLPETCGCCGIELETGMTRVSLIRLIGQIDWSDELNNSELSIIDGEDVLSFCAVCGNKMSTNRLRQALHKLIDDVAVPERHEYGTPNPAVDDTEKLMFERKANLLQRALAQADEMDRKQGKA